MLKSLRTTQVTEPKVIFSIKSPMTEIQNTHQKVETPKMHITLSECVLVAMPPRVYPYATE